MNNDSCRLIAINMLGAVHFPYTKDATFDFDEWYDMCYKGMRLMDDLVDLEIEHIDRILAKIETDSEPESIKFREREIWYKLREVGLRGRRTGLGITALGDMLASLGLPYDSPQSLALLDSIFETKLRAELDATINLAKERGKFHDFDAKLEAKLAKEDSSFFNLIKLQFPEQWKKMQKYGRRNISWSTVAPTGSLSILAQTTSGIEPLFTPYYIRRKKINPSDKNVRIDFTDQNGDNWQEFPVMHPQFRFWIEKQNVNPDELSEEQLQEFFEVSPWYKSTANDIDWIKRVEIQSIVQKYTTHSISSTINLPSDISIDKVKEIYFESWKMGLKGITVYRDGSRTGVLVTDSRKSPKRPKELVAKYHAVKADGDWYGIVIGFLDGKPYEIFAYPHPEDHYREVTGKVVKRKSGIYEFNSKELVIENLNDTPGEIQLVTRMSSGFLRHGADVDFVVGQINKCNLTVTSLGTAIKRILYKYANNQEIKGVSCENCGSKNVIMQEGCMTCRDCGSSKCG